MEAADIVRAIASIRWAWTLAGVDPILRRMPAARYRQTPEWAEYRTPAGQSVKVRLAGPGVVESIALAFARSRDPETLDEGGASGPGNVQEFLEREAERAVELAKAGDVDAGIEILEHVVATAPFWGTAWNDLGILLGYRRDLGRALQCFDRALAEDPELLALVTENRVRAYGDSGRLPERVADLRRLFGAGQATAEQSYELANLLRAEGDEAACRTALAHFVEHARPEWRDEAERARRWLATPPRT